MREWLYPLNYERRYSNYLEKSLTEVRREFLARLQTLPNWNSDNIEFLLTQMREWWNTKREEKKRNLIGYFGLINTFNDKQFIAVVAAGTGLILPNYGGLSSSYTDLVNRFGNDADIFRQESYLPELQKNWTSTQDIYLDKTVTSTVIDAALIVKDAVLIDAARRAIIDAITGKFNRAGNNASSFGKDQVSKINTELEKARAKSLNLDIYEWITRKDERVRGNPAGLYPKAKPSHFAREGKFFRWNQPPEGGHPGEAPGCRCKARIYFKK